LKTANKIVTSTGKKIQTWNPAADHKEDILKKVIGRSGNLRVPTLKIENLYIIGFNAEYYQTL